MKAVTLSGEQFEKLLEDVETLVEDVAALVSQDEIARQRLAEIKDDPSIGLSEEELDAYLKRRGV